ncbi:MAG: cytochrome P450 [Actinomycetota bacterium]
MELQDIDLLSRDIFTERVPHDWFEFLRKNAPIHKHPEPDGPGFWVFTKYDDLVALHAKWELLSSDQQRGGVVGLEELPAEQREEMEAMNQGGKMMLTMDPPDHTRYRKLVNKGFTPRVIRSLEDHMREMSIRIVEESLANDGGVCDFVVDMAAELPLEAIAEFLGVPFEDRRKLFDWSNRMIGSEDPEYIITEESTNEARIEMFMYSHQLAEDRRLAPRDDIVSKLIHGEVDGHQLSEMDFNLFFLLLAVAGNETTRNAMSHGMAALLDHPEQYQMLVDDPSLVGSATEEILRWASPVMYFRRNVTEDMEFKGHEIKEGDKVSLWYISANRDEDVFDDPYTFNILRDPNPHIAFGGGGPHFCLGANLARMEIKVLFEELVKRVGRIEKLTEPSRLRSNFINGLKHLPVRLVPAKATASVR